MSNIFGNFLGFLGSDQADTGYQISRSLRFNSSDSAYLSRTPASAGNQQTFSISFWTKLASIGVFTFISSQSGTVRIGTSTNNVLAYDITPVSGSRLIRTTTAVLRDPSAWYHILFSVNTTSATQEHRFRVYVNGVEVLFDVLSLGSGYLPQNSTIPFNNTSLHEIGRRVSDNDTYWNGYLADVHFIDGQALTPSSFTEVSATTGQLIPKAYSGPTPTGNSFWLPFSDNSAATATTLGKDNFNLGNNWTPNNLSVTAGAGNDSLVDTPTSYGTDTGAGGEVRGNYCTLNPLAIKGTVSLSNGNLETTMTVVSSRSIGTFGVNSGKWYAEFVPVSSSSAPDVAIGVIPISKVATIGTNETAYLSGDGNVYKSGVAQGAAAATYGVSDIIGIALNMDTFEVSFYKNNSFQKTVSLNTDSDYTFSVFQATSNTILVACNFGQRPFAYTAPSGFKALCDTNLPAPVVAKPSTVMDVKLYTGNGSTQTISGLSFSPDLVWIKERNAAADHALYDSVRGVQQQLESNTTTDETTESTGLTAFNSDGFALSSLAQVNTNTDTYVAWCWDESATAGFDIVTYTGNGSARTISHGLGVAPNMIIVKARTTASTDQGWPVYHSANTAAPATDYLLLNSTAATADLDTVWNDTAPTSSVFSVGTNALVNTNNDTYVAYLFSAVVGYSSFGSYTGNGSADGPFVFLGFRPAVVIVKMSSSTGNWTILDYQREGYNVDNDPLFPNLSNAEGTTDLVDLTSNGFKVRTTDATFNTNAGTYVYAAWAQNPFQYARAR